MSKDINKSKFTQETQTKLEIFSECFREWFPVFLHNPYMNQIHVYDFFAGSGTDSDGEPGSPLLLLSEARGENCSFCSTLRGKNKPVVFHFNEKMKEKAVALCEAVARHIKNCEKNCLSTCTFSCPDPTQVAFKDAFHDSSFKAILNNPNYAKFVLLDQYGFSQVDVEIFSRLILAPATDFIFFISSSYIKRFKDHPSTKQYFDTTKITFDESRPQDCHRQIADYFQSLVSSRKEYYLHSFTIQKGGNYLGLIFGSNHTLGMEKFLKVCWGKDPNSGESNCNIDGDWENGTLFRQQGKSNKRESVKKELRENILRKEITTSVNGLKHSLQKRCLPSLFIEVIKEMEKAGEVSLSCVDGSKPSYAATNIHKVKEFQIHLNTSKS